MKELTKEEIDYILSMIDLDLSSIGFYEKPLLVTSIITKLTT